MEKDNNDLFVAERRSLILQILERENRVSVPDLSSRFEVSEDTIRRDLRLLQAQGLIHKTHGGALRHNAESTPYLTRLAQSSELKMAIGKRAAELVEEGDSIIVDSGTTTLSLARALTIKKARVLTNDLEIARVVAERPHYELIVLGGRWDPVHHELIGPATVEQLSRYRVHKFFLGMAALDRRNGLTDVSEEDAAVKRAMIDVAEQVIGLADHSKLGRVAFAWVAPASEIDVLVTDDLADCSSFADLDWEVVRVSSGENTQDKKTAVRNDSGESLQKPDLRHP